MSEEAVPQQGGGSAQPKGLLQQMEELMAALNADLSDLHEEAGFPTLGSQEHLRSSAGE
ncbi:MULTISPECIES: hypothetical protein [unclassified Streptomyces]|uniref:hypothetical protein n=1 Tax=unclassified Streptomyces TaxID=2593676 RepID=UPI001F0350C3|nr:MULTISPECIES: hypothetical protein [unclassified Streptomyces]MCH0561734.1 hypothetical protein [Streptomyces sp. MUM 2J]MCH0569020.1 hypothetical protein [Streptomyces sp. MUM 136J]